MAHNLEHGLVSYWKLDGNGNDEQGTNPGTTESGLGYVAGKFGQAPDFDGVNDYFNVPNHNSLSFPDAITISTWVNVDSGFAAAKSSRLGGMSNGWSGPGGWFVQVDTTGYHNQGNGLMASLWIMDGVGGGNGKVLTRGVPINVGQWQHIVATFDKSVNGNDKIKVYVNNGNPTSGGVVTQQAFNTAAGGHGINPNVVFPFVMGAHSGGNNTSSATPGVGTYPWSGMFPGLIDDTAVWTRALTAAEVLDIYTRGTAGQSLLETTAPVDGSGFSITVV